MAKFDPDGFDRMMAELNAEAEADATISSPYEEFEPEYEFISGVRSGVS